MYNCILSPAHSPAAAPAAIGIDVLLTLPMVGSTAMLEVTGRVPGVDVEVVSDLVRPCVVVDEMLTSGLELPAIRDYNIHISIWVGQIEYV